MIKSLLNHLKDPETRLSLFMVGFLFYLFSPLLYWFWLKSELESGAFPVNADSIGIPFAGFVLFWFVGLIVLPITVFFIALWRKILKLCLR